MLTYSWDIMWLDAIALMPLVILGLHRMVRDGKFLLYTLALAGSLICNYYIALFVCIFTALYFPVCYFSMSPYLREAERNPLLHFSRLSENSPALLCWAPVSARSSRCRPICRCS